MGYNNSAVQILQQAEDLKIKVLTKHDLLNETQAWTDQQKLQSVYHQALILDLEYSLDKKVEQDLWNIGFKNHISILQELVRDKKNPQRSDCQALLNWCLESASGFYITLLHEFCNTYDLDFPFRRNGKIYGQIIDSTLAKDNLNFPQSSSCLYICQYCLVHLGDIARYRNQRKQAESFYKHAIQVSPNSGHPYNQLALLEASLGDKLSTVFYYIRGIAVKNPFPAASTNLMSTLNSTIDKQKFNDTNQTKLTSNEFIQLFLRVHCYFYTMMELEKAEIIVKQLGTIMTALVATESFNEDKLIKMTVVNLYALRHVCPNTISEEGLTDDEEKVRTMILDLLAGFLSALLMPVYTLKSEDNLMDYYALPAVKIILCWIRETPSILTENVFMKRLQIWPSFCKLLNNSQPYLDGFKYDDYYKLPLPEDRELKGFLPLSKYLKQFDYSTNEENAKVRKTIRLRRISDFAVWLTGHEVNGTKLITKTEKAEGGFKFEPGSVQPDPTNELLEEIKSFGIVDSGKSNCPETKKSVERKAGILKPQGSLEKSREERELMASSGENSAAKAPSTGLSVANNDDNNGGDGNVSGSKQETAKMKRVKQNVALQSIFKKMEENKQVKFTVEEKSKDKLVKFEQKQTPSIIKLNNNNNNNNNNSNTNNIPHPQFGVQSGARTSGSGAQPTLNAPPTFNGQRTLATPIANNNNNNANQQQPQAQSHNQQSDYLTTLRNMANYNSGGMMGAGGGAWGGVPNAYGAGGGASWGAAPAQPKANFNPMNMGPATFNHLQSGGYDGSATANWWNNQGGANMMGGGFGGGFGAGGGGMLGGMNPMMLNNQASGDTFGNPWATGGGFDQGGGNMSMRQQMLKEANGMSKNMSSRVPPPNKVEPISYCHCHD